MTNRKYSIGNNGGNNVSIFLEGLQGGMFRRIRNSEKKEMLLPVHVFDLDSLACKPSEELTE